MRPHLDQYTHSWGCNQIAKLNSSESTGMATTSQGWPSRMLPLLQWGWYAGLAGAAFTVLLVNGDPSAALVLAIVLPVAMLRTHGTRTITTLALAGGVAIMAMVLSTRSELDPSLRSTFLSVGMLAPALGLAVAMPMCICWIQEKRACPEHMPEIIAEPVDQSSMMLMSDSTTCGTLGRLTSETKRSKAA